jgi:deazaflavin-dependent oxidoreductase (nitroreductase family)
MDYEAFTQNLMADIRAHGRPTGGPMEGRPLMILTTKGAKTGAERSAVVTYTRDGDRYVIAATASGSPTNPDWYHNLKAHPEATVEAEGKKFRARAVEAQGDEAARLYEQHATERPEFREYPKKVTRRIPVFTLERIA